MQKGIPFSQAKRYRRITSDYDCFQQDLNRLETYFKRRNYPVDILTEALQKASNLTIEEVLKSSSSEVTTRMLSHSFAHITLPSQTLVKLLTNTGVYLKYRQVKCSPLI